MVGQHVAAVGELAETSAELAESAAQVADAVDYDTLQLDGGGVDLEALRAYRDPVIRSDQAVEDAAATIAVRRSPWLLAPLQSRMDSLEEKILDVAPDTQMARLAVEFLPAMLGEDGVQRYLVLFGSPAEARDLGGHIGHWAELEADNGRLDLTKSGPIIDLWLGGTVNRRLMNESLYPASYIDNRPQNLPQNWGASPDMPASPEPRRAVSAVRRQTRRWYCVS